MWLPALPKQRVFVHELAALAQLRFCGSCNLCYVGDRTAESANDRKFIPRCVSEEQRGRARGHGHRLEVSPCLPHGTGKFPIRQVYPVSFSGRIPTAEDGAPRWLGLAGGLHLYLSPQRPGGSVPDSLPFSSLSFFCPYFSMSSALAQYESFLVAHVSTISSLESTLRSITWILPGRFKDAELASEARQSCCRRGY